MSYPNLVSNLYSPKIIWYQTDVFVVIRILLQDVENYFLRVKCDYLLFSTTINGKNYYVCLYLFGAVVAEKTIHRNLGREIKVTLEKAHKWTEWLRLHVEKEKNPFIIADLDHLYKNNWHEAPLKIERESLAEYKRKNNITHIMPVVPSSDEEESDDEIMDMLFY
ncbi:putative ATP-dependent RNA helicase TDRD12 isoform X1 [Ptiloglossa arizonensis]|uniref:putative ATP-dependent RNA helicase TDRD12 isoform X1 n=1 Tax=Ptiloglossa arizonensis TaxID=3350558 RepID=UPI003F9F7A64